MTFVNCAAGGLNALGALKAAVARTIETQIGELIARPADLSLLAGMLKQLSRRVP